MTDRDPVRQLLAPSVPEPDVERALAEVRRRARRVVRQRRLAAVAAAVVVVAAVAAGVGASRSTDPEGQPPVDHGLVEVEPTVPTTTVLSAQHPVRVEPRQDLREGQQVTVTGRGFPPGRLLQVTTCLPEALTGAGVPACHALATTAVHARDDGTLEVTHPVRRMIMVAGTLSTVDCAVVEGGCIVAVGDAFDAVESGGVPVTFDPSVPVPEPPEVVVTPDDDLREGDEVLVTATGFDRRDYINANVCVLDDAGTGYDGCEGAPIIDRRDLIADAAGELSFTMTVHRRLEPLGPEPMADCGAMSCVLVLIDSRYRTLSPLSFDPDEPPPLPPSAEISLPDRLTSGARAEIDAEHFRPGQDIIAYLCPAEARREPPPCLGEQLGYVQADEDGSAHLQVRVPGETPWYPNDPETPEQSTIDCARRPGRCDLIVTNFYDVIERVPLTFGDR